MRTSDATNDITAALVKAQAVMKNAPFNQVNPHFKSKFADLAAVRDTIIPPLTANGIGVVQTLEPTPDGITHVITRLLHTSGQWIESCCPIPLMPDMQKMGGAITYARRYSLSAICGIAAEEDDDGTTAAQTPIVKATPKPVPAGFEEWLIELQAKADKGGAELYAFWNKSQPFMRKHLTDSDRELWERIKERADAAVVAK